MENTEKKEKQQNNYTFSRNSILHDIGSIKPLPHTTIMQQTKQIENLYNWMDKLWLKVENIVVKGEIVRFEQFLLLSLCFQKAVSCRGVRKLQYEGKG